DARARRGVAMAAAVDQVGRAGGAHAGVVEPLEQRLAAAAQVREVHVVDGVVERAHDAEGAGGGKGRAVFDISALTAVEPIHRGYVVDVRRGPGGDRRRR